MKKLFPLLFLLFLSACLSPQVTEETDCCLAVNVTVPVPTETQTPLPIFTQTLNPTQFANQQIANATQNPFLTKVAEFPHICPEDVPYFSAYGPQISPDGNWLGEVCWAYDKEFKDLVLSFSNRETRVQWNLLYHDYIPDVDFADGGMWVVKWSNDSKYAYFTTSLGGDGGYCIDSGVNSGNALFRIEVDTGKVTPILALNKVFWWYGFSISPTDRRLFYGERSVDLKILDITTGETINVAHKRDFNQSGGYIWATDGLHLIYSTIIDNYDTGYFETTVRLVDILTGNEEIILEALDNCYVVKEWKNNVISIEKDAERVVIEFDLTTNTIISETPIKP